MWRRDVGINRLLINLGIGGVLFLQGHQDITTGAHQGPARHIYATRGGVRMSDQNRV